MALVICLLLLITCTVRGDPAGCTYFPSSLKYECSSRNWVLPLALSDFDNVPQSLTLIDINGDLPSSTPTATFTGFDVINTTLFDTNFVPTFTIQCYTGGMLIYHNGTFSGLGYIKEVRIQNCEVIALPDQAFQDFGDLNYLGFENGVIGDIGFDAFKGLNIYPMAVPRPLGMLLMTSKLEGRVLPNGVFYHLTNATNFVIDGTNLDTVQADMFQASIKLRFLSMRHNWFTSFPSNILSNLHGLQILNLDGIKWDCTCDNLWFLDYCQTNNVSLRGSMICNSPSTYKDKKAYLFKKEECPAEIVLPCDDDLTGIAVGNTCLTYPDIAVYVVSLLSLSLVIATLLINVHTRRQNADDLEDKSMTNLDKGSQRKLSGSNWNRASDNGTEDINQWLTQANRENDIADEIM
ncbi:leucine-rich repeat-containing protein 4B-like [Ylistrum balloti]|uniref:leucine-rich repeat-containing protein 4B-like n=1 Tax=Ylistrum balloti TaxID=509963 RepID=UPI002905999A|nr:leucine-rich repeat-containing protein 4B-like [Ylistrum balloti]